VTDPWPLDASELLGCLLDDLGSGSVRELSSTMTSRQLTPTSALVDLGPAGRFRLTVHPEPRETRASDSDTR
jgi:hypothetical protein